MTDEMLHLARRNAADAGVANPDQDEAPRRPVDQ
jgi:hypothetical protein